MTNPTRDIRDPATLIGCVVAKMDGNGDEILRRVDWFQPPDLVWYRLVTRDPWVRVKAYKLGLKACKLKTWRQWVAGGPGSTATAGRRRAWIVKNVDTSGVSL